MTNHSMVDYFRQLFKTVFIVILITSTGEMSGQDYGVLTYNIRYDNKNDNQDIWDNRKDGMVQLLKHHAPVVIGIQEGLKHQVAFLDEKLVDYSYVGVGRDDGVAKGEYCAIFYDNTRLNMIRTGTFWLSDTPNAISVGWDAALERICTYALMEDKKAKNQFWVFNTHFDHRGAEARKMSASLILKKIKEINSMNLPVILMGDFNAEPHEAPILTITEELEDGKKNSEANFYGPIGTSCGFEMSKVIDRRIDYIFTMDLKVLSYVHIDDRLNSNRQISDHLPVLVKVEIH